MQKHTHQQVPGRLEFPFFLWMLQRLSLCMFTSFFAVSRGKTQDRLSLCIYNSSYAVSRDRTQDQLQVLFVDSVPRCRQGVCYMSLSNGSDGSLSMKFIFPLTVMFEHCFFCALLLWQQVLESIYTLLQGPDSELMCSKCVWLISGGMKWCRQCYVVWDCSDLICWQSLKAWHFKAQSACSTGGSISTML
jgi:hypothetical protein